MATTVATPCATCTNKGKTYVPGEQNPCSSCNAKASKHDTGKPRHDLIPPEMLDGLARLYGMGAGKYDDRNWEKGMNWSRLYRAMQSHANKWFSGVDYDEEDGQHHLLSVIWNATALYTYQARRVGTDNRPKYCTTGDALTAFWSNKKQVKQDSYQLKATIERTPT